MEQKIVKTDLPGFVKDINNGSVMNTDTSALSAYKKNREVRKTQEEDINTLKEEMGEIKSLLKEFIRKQV